MLAQLCIYYGKIGGDGRAIEGIVRYRQQLNRALACANRFVP